MYLQCCSKKLSPCTYVTTFEYQVKYKIKNLSGLCLSVAFSIAVEMTTYLSFYYKIISTQSSLFPVKKCIMCQYRVLCSNHTKQINSLCSDGIYTRLNMWSFWSETGQLSYSIYHTRTIHSISRAQAVLIKLFDN